MNWDDVELQLLCGMPIDIGSNTLAHTPTLKEIIGMGYSNYNQLLSILMFDKSNVSGQIQENISDFEYLYLVAHHDPKFKELVLNSLNLIFKCDAHPSYSKEDVFFVVGDGRIDKDNFPILQELVCKMNWIKRDKKQEYNPANEKARQLIEMIKSAKITKPKPKETMNLYSIINGLSWRPNDMSIRDIFDITIYQLYAGFFSTENYDNYTHTLNGVYAGTINGKDIDFKNIHWAKVLDKK